MTQRRNQNNSTNDDITRIEDLVPLEHPPLPKLPNDTPPDFTASKIMLPSVESLDLQIHDDNFTLKKNTEIEKTTALPIDNKEDQILKVNSSDDLSNKFDLNKELNIDSSTSVSELNNFFQSQEFENITEKTDLSILEKNVKTKEQEFFKDIKDEVETFVLKHVPFDSYPSYSLHISKILRGPQKNEILLLLKEFNLFQSEAEKQLVERSLQRGQLLIPRISEYAGIYLTNKLELFNLDIKLSPSEDFTSHHENWDVGPLTEETFHHHQENGFERSFINDDFENNNEIFITQAFYIPNKKLTLLGKILQEEITLDVLEDQNLIELIIPKLNRMKIEAVKLNSNAIVGITFLQKNQREYLITGEAAIMENEF